jgi:hypothetical protein
VGKPGFSGLFTIRDDCGTLYNAGIRLGRLIHEIRYFLVFSFICLRVSGIGHLRRGWMPSISMHAGLRPLIVCWRLLLVVCMGVLLMATTRTADIRAALVWFLKPLPFWNEKMAATMVGWW